MASCPGPVSNKWFLRSAGSSRADQFVKCRAGAVEIIAPLPDGQRVTLSMGVVVSPFGSDLREALMRADQQLYKAKELGRDQVVVHGPGDVAAAA